MTCKNYKVPQLKWGDAMLNILTPAYWHCLKNHPQSQPGCFPVHSQNHILKPGLKKPSQPSWINYQGKSLGICPDMGPMISTVVFPRLKIVFFFAGETHDDSWTTSIAACHVKNPIPAADRAMIGATEWCCHVKFVTISSSPQAIRLIKQ